MSTLCPQCGGLKEADGKSCSCGWRKGEYRSKKDAVLKLCGYNDHGDECGYPGPLSLSTNGEGPWYCRKHFAMIAHMPAPPDMPAEDTASARDLRVEQRLPRAFGESEHDWSMRCRDYVKANTRKMIRAKRDPSQKDLDWAFKIAMREARGQSVPLAVSAMANEAMSGRKLPAREPGCDDE